MLSLKNILSPLVDKKNLITIILVASFFAVYRMSGGRIHGPELPSVRDEIAPIVDQDISSLDAISPGAAQARLRQNSQIEETEDEELTEALDTPIEQPRAPAPPARDDSGFEDIEKSLGLR